MPSYISGLNGLAYTVNTPYVWLLAKYIRFYCTFYCMVQYICRILAKFYICIERILRISTKHHTNEYYIWTICRLCLDNTLFAYYWANLSWLRRFQIVLWKLAVYPNNPTVVQITFWSNELDNGYLLELVEVNTHAKLFETWQRSLQ